MKIDELLSSQKEELKQKYLAKKENRDLYYSELAQINLLVSDDEIINEYGFMDFGNDDFFCTAGEEEMSTADLLVSILNYVLEKQDEDFDVKQIGFGYTINQDGNPVYSMADGSSFKDGLYDLWKSIGEKNGTN